METAGKRFRIRSGLVVLLFLIIPHFSAAVEAEWKDQIIENQRFTLKYITTYGGRQSVDIQDPLWPEGISKISGPYTAQRTVQNEDGTFATVLQVIYTLRGNNPGIFTVSPVIVSDGLTEQRSESLQIPILRKDEGFLRYPLLLDWGESPETLYTGQAVPLILMMKNMEEISLPDSVSISTPESALLEQVRGLGDIQYSSLGENTLFHVPMQTWMLTPSKAGELTLGSVQVKILGLTRKSEKLDINVLELPEEVSASGGAVGDFQFSLDISESRTTVDEAVVLTIRIEGVGNLNYLELPEPIFPESVTVVEKDSSNYLAMERGFEGRREIQYIITAKEEGSSNIHIPPFSWLNPENAKISYSPSRDIKIDVLSLLDTLKDSNARYTLLSADELIGGKSFSFYKSPSAYLLLLPGVFILILSRFRKVRKSLLLSSILLSVLFMSSALPEDLDQSWISEAENYFEADDYDSALSLYLRSARDWQDNWVFQYNKGVLHFLNKEDAQAVASLRKALYMSNSNVQVQNTLESLEENLGLDNQIDLSVLMSPNLVFFLFILTVNLLLVTIAWLLIKNSSLPVFLLLVLSLTVLGTGTELVRSIWLLNRNEAVVRQDVAIKKIPEVRGSSWITIQEGTSVELVSDYENFTLIRSAYGLEGWILKKDLIPVNGDSSDEI
ncbi:MULTISPECIES: BatD family protein [unclassified Oceanispirochaeta]|uniref:BatD family protein n=1 Tax=unclassified Oceanispirochaeta TaxID=2635722 RepID=UPI000E09A56D|nr:MULTISPECIES: BatD family protein [unclassified Oceanispirochaeta]MBF9017826.1 BatD family protein [Oceanispirochaeta sp. M2]NPD74286.1 hypothetical protein [Oceanispirochaeta sp. M1]RDG29876.1 hypothetical protein DV872_19485 [Oceanispirochaeta sp. M1]